MSDVLIMGGGIGGLFSGALLAHEGYHVTLLERQHTLGGGLQCFHRQGRTYPTGMHMTGGLQPGGQLDRICRYLGILDHIRLLPLNAESADEIYFSSNGHSYQLPIGRESYTQSLCHYFPHENEGINRYIEAIYRLADEEDLLQLRPERNLPHSDEFYLPVDQFIAQYIHDSELQRLLFALAPLYGGVVGQTPAYMHALLSVLHIEGTCQFDGGSQQLADALAEEIRHNGGALHTSEEVTAFDLDGRAIRAVHTRQGSIYHAEHYISALPTQQLLDIAPEGAFPPSFRQRLTEAPVTNSAFTLVLQLRENTIPAQNRSLYLPDDNTLLLDHPQSSDHRYAESISLLTPMSFDEVQQWSDTIIGRRGDSYLHWKQQQSERLISIAERHYPNIRQAIIATDAATPLTYRDYNGTRNGALYGLQRDCRSLMLTQLSVRTKVKNLFLTGQDVNVHGLCGVALTAIATAETILGEPTLRTKINNTI